MPTNTPILSRLMGLKIQTSISIVSDFLLTIKLSGEVYFFFKRSLLYKIHKQAFAIRSFATIILVIPESHSGCLKMGSYCIWRLNVAVDGSTLMETATLQT